MKKLERFSTFGLNEAKAVKDKNTNKDGIRKMFRGADLSHILNGSDDTTMVCTSTDGNDYSVHKFDDNKYLVSVVENTANVDEADRKYYGRDKFATYPYQMYFSDNGMADAVGAKSVKELIDKVAKKRGLKAFAIFKAGQGFHSTTQEEFLVNWYDEEDGSYWANRAKKEPEVEKKRLKNLTGNLKLQEGEGAELDSLIPDMKAAFSAYLEDKDMVDLIDSLDKIALVAKKIAKGKKNEGLWWRYFKNDTLANTIENVEKNLELPKTHNNHKHTIECMEIAVKPDTEMKIYYS